jgi:hypothetical protein
LGFRRIVRKLSVEGHKIGKDKAWRLYKKHKAFKPSSIEEDKELGELKDKEEKARKNFELTKQKNELRRSIVAFAVQRLMEDYDQRRRIFTEKDRLLKFARKTLRVTDPAIWTRFSEYCEMHGFELAGTLLAVLGPQELFEEQLVGSEKLGLELYLASRMKCYLNSWENQTEKNNYSSQQAASKETDEYLGDDGFWYIKIQSHDDHE